MQPSPLTLILILILILTPSLVQFDAAVAVDVEHFERTHAVHPLPVNALMQFIWEAWRGATYQYYIPGQRGQL